ncbi:formate dehydrogenase subunit gamma [Paraglaciecola aquimarina]|uniref:NADH-quinone oxidoreductase subunit E n=1 Tax=Paraglaciecola aquimarina TaxID=1235557 RepID=A0ABU3ST20_9ALTE|nr:formate dehydrogenase subunit gamma [Paraglaciecola aquimarina]MDU0353158.1 formate dehydrogenase subunit gamma [Paraglaciecola aquimarina]
MSDVSNWDPVAVSEIIDSLRDVAGALLPILHAIQDSQGYIPEDSVAMIASALHQTSAEIHGVISFYHHFRTAKPGNHIVQICRAEACQARGARVLEHHAKTSLKLDYHGTTADQEFTLEPVYCLGNCTNGPNVQIDDEIIARVSPEKFDQLLDQKTTYIVELK